MRNEYDLRYDELELLPEDINFNKEACERIEDWYEKHRIPVIIPNRRYDEVKRMYFKFKQTSVFNQHRADEITMRYVGKTNDDLFRLIKIRNQRADNDNLLLDVGESIKERTWSPNPNIGNCEYVDPEKITIKNLLESCEGKSISNIQHYKIKNVLESFLPKGLNLVPFRNSNFPILTNLEMSAISISENSNFNENEKQIVREWQELYGGVFDGIDSERYQQLSIDRIKILKKFNFLKDIERDNKDKFNNEILELGWLPELEYNEENQKLANERILNIIENKYKDIDSVDVSSIIESLEETSINEAESNSEYHPCFIVFKRTKNNILNTAIAKATKSYWAHAAITFDTKLKNMYTFDMFNGGFSRESIYDYPSGTEINVMCCFVNTDIKNKMIKQINTFKKIKDKTRYGIENFISCLTKKSNDNNLAMVCSNFVDYIMKTGGISTTTKAFSTVHPGHLKRAIGQSKKRRFYDVYKGVIEKYNANKVKLFIANISSVNESKSINNLDKYTEELFKKTLEPYMSMVAIEEEDFPVQFNKEGDLLIYKKDIDFEKEYANSHRLLKTYESTDNIEGMKYELAKLWYMNNLLQDEIYSKNGKDKKDAVKVRARILNDFNKYLKIVIKHEKGFNFQKYYKNTPYGDNRTRIRSSTIRYGIDTIKRILIK